MEDPVIFVSIVFDSKTIKVPFTKQTTAEDVCLHLCKQLAIGPVARHLFTLREHNSKLFIALNSVFTEKNTKYDLRIRYKVADISRLKRIDIRAYDYYFHQARNDVLDNKIPDIVYEKYKRELVGLGVADMYRVMVEKDIPRDTVENEYRKYIPKEVIKRHSFFIKKPIHDSLGKIRKSGHDAWYVKAEYLKQLEIMAPEYLAEEYRAVTDLNGCVNIVHVKVSPFHPSEPGIRILYDSKRDGKWQQLCTIEDLCFISARNDGTVEISRKNGIPSYLKFQTLPTMYAFVSLLDGYYRLMVKWIFNLCKEVPTPSLQKLYSMKCHGPVGGEFSYAKLEEKRANRPGCFVLRESETKYNTYYIDVCTKYSTKPKSYKLEKISSDEFIFNDDLRRYKSIQQLMAAYSDPDSLIYLHECLPPTEYDQSPLLLCQQQSPVSPGDVTVATLLNDNNITSITMPICINIRDLQVYKGQKKESQDGVTVVYRSMWKIGKGKITKLPVAMKVLKHEHCDKYLKEFLELAHQWAFLSSSAIVRLYGLTLRSPISLVMEYVRLGPLDEYLRVHRSLIKTVDLVEAASYLASALWHLEENGIVHGHIRCHRLLTFQHDDTTFTVKLSDPGIHVPYSAKDVHWIPVEFYSNLEYARQAPTADVWAFATTLWEIFTYGETLPPADQFDIMRFYKTGKRLTQPTNCPIDIYQIMCECWDLDPHRRKRPQAIMRDINQILYQVFNSRKVHAYAKIFTKSKDSTSSLSAAAVTQSANNLYNNGSTASTSTGTVTTAQSQSMNSLFSNVTHDTYLGGGSCDGDGGIYCIDKHNNDTITSIIGATIDDELLPVSSINHTDSYDLLSLASSSSSRQLTTTINTTTTTTSSTIIGGGCLTATTSIPNYNNINNNNNSSSSNSSNHHHNQQQQHFHHHDHDIDNNCEDSSSVTGYDLSTILSNLNFSTCSSTAATSLDSINLMQSICELDDDYNVVLQGRIGQGFYGEVFRGTLEYVGDKDIESRQVAVKKLKNSVSGGTVGTVAGLMQDFQREINIMKALKHPNIVEILGVYEDPEVSLVMEYVPHGSLQSYLKIYREMLTTSQLLKYALDIAKGMEYLGQKHIVHRDLAARNILVVDENHVKISDFGLAQVIGTKEYYILKTNRDLPIKWYAPESLRDGKFSPKSDVWSYGVTLYEMFSWGEEPRLSTIPLTRLGCLSTTTAAAAAATTTIITPTSSSSSSSTSSTMLLVNSTSGSTGTGGTNNSRHRHHHQHQHQQNNELCNGIGQEQRILLDALESGTRLPCPVACPQAVYVRIIYPCWDANPHNRPSFLQLCTDIKDSLTQY